MCKHLTACALIGKANLRGLKPLDLMSGNGAKQMTLELTLTESEETTVKQISMSSATATVSEQQTSNRHYFSCGIHYFS